MKPLYSTSFFIDATPANIAGRYNEALEHIKTWIGKKYSRWGSEVKFTIDGTNCAPIERHSLVAREKSEGAIRFLTLNWQHPDEKDKELNWRTDIQLACTPEKLSFSLQLSLVMTVISPPRYDIWPPAIISTLTSKFTCTTPSGEAINSCHKVLPADSVAAFITEALLNKNRQLPAILVSKDIAGEVAIDLEWLVRRCMGIANVYLLEDKWASWKLTEILGAPIACYNGAVRIYWPKMSASDSPFKHNLFIKPVIQKKNLIEHKFENETALRLMRLSLIVDHSFIGKAVENSIDDARIAKLQAAHEQGKLKDEQLLGMIKELNEKILSEQRQSADLQDKLNESKFHVLELEDSNKSLEEELADVQEQFRQYQSAVPATVGGTQVEQPEPEALKNVFSAVDLAAKDFKTTLVFHERAIESAKESIYKDPDRVYQLFAALDEICAKWQTDGKIGDTWKNVLDKKGFDFKQDISITTKGKYGEEYFRPYKGKRVSIAEHVTLSKGGPETCLSVHFWRDEETKTLLIGHCGKHLTNTKT